MNPSRPLPDLAALAAQLRLMACAMAAALLEALGARSLAAALRRQMARELAEMERLATGVVVLAALRLLPPPPPETGAQRSRPSGAPRGFARVAGDANAMRAMQRKLFPRRGGLVARLRRFDAVLDDVAAHAARLARHVERIPPAFRLVAVAPPAWALRLQVDAVATFASDTS